MARPAEQVRAAVPPVGRTVLLLAGLAAAGFALKGLGRAALTAPAPTPAGAAALVCAGGLLAAAGVPRQAVAFAGGYAFGAWRGGVLAMIAQMLGCAADFWWARAVARDWARRRLRGRLARFEGFLTARPFAATLTLRLLPVGNNLALNLLGGISGLRAAPFFAASLIGYLPQTVVFALVGSGIQLQRGVQLAVGLALFAASAGLGLALVRAGRRRGSLPVELAAPP